MIGPHQIRAVAHTLRKAFDFYYAAFLEITRQAQERFESRSWVLVVREAEERIGLYHAHLDDIEAQIRPLLGEGVTDREIWDRIKPEYIALYLNHYHCDLALIFFYSVMRRVLLPTGASVEYSDDEIRAGLKGRLEELPRKPFRVYPKAPIDRQVMRRILDDLAFQVPFQHGDLDAELAAQALNEDLDPMIPADGPDAIEILENIFFRNKAAYVIGRIRTGDRIFPLVLVLLNPSQGVVLDAVLTSDPDVSNVFTSARSNFHVKVDAYREVFEFLLTVAHSRASPYLMSAMGFIHPAKLELVRALREHMCGSQERFQTAPGVPGTVMAAFALPGFGYVFKVIRESSTKETYQGVSHVIGKYWKVHRMDRVGRMLDIMTLHNLRFRQDSFESELLEELLATAPNGVCLEGDQVVFRHLYAERRIIPLNIFLADKTVSEEDRHRAVIDYGKAIKDLAAANVFVGDYMTKNFGVSRYGRVILYDYDDIDELQNWNFRHMPEPPEWAETMAYDDWMSKSENDVFPDYDFRIFLVPQGYRELFNEHHGDLYQPDLWNRLKGVLQAGDVPDIYPYPQRLRLSRRFPEGVL